MSAAPAPPPFLPVAPASLARARVGVALVLLADLTLRARDLGAHYSDQGLVPRASLSLPAWDFLWSLHTLGGSLAFAGLLFALAFLGALALLLGWRARTAALISWLLACSLHARNPLVRGAEDDLLRALLLLFALSPIGARLSLDHRRAPAEPEVPLLPRTALTLQLASIHVFGAAAKLASPWWSQGEAARLALSMETYQTAAGGWLLDYPGLLRAFTWALPWVELGLTALLFVPERRGRVRRGVVAAFVLLHLAFALFLHTGLLPWLSIAAWLAMWPGETPAAVAPARAPWGRARAGAAALALVLVLALGLPSVAPGLRPPRALVQVGVALGLHQYWSAFAPRVLTPLVQTDGRFELSGEGAGGEALPLSAPGPASGQRWRYLFENLKVSYGEGEPRAAAIGAARQGLLAAACAANPALRGVRLLYHARRLGSAGAGTQRVELGRRTCGTEPAVHLGRPLRYRGADAPGSGDPAAPHLPRRVRARALQSAGQAG